MSIITIIVILVAVIVVVATIIFMNLYENSYFARNKFEELARRYYETSLYDNFLSEHKGEDLSVAFEKYAEFGFDIKLRQLLNSEYLMNGQNYRAYFETNVYTCDTNASSAKFIPYAPFGKKDYNLEIKLECTKN